MGSPKLVSFDYSPLPVTWFFGPESRGGKGGEKKKKWCWSNLISLQYNSHERGAGGRGKRRKRRVPPSKKRGKGEEKTKETIVIDGPRAGRALDGREGKEEKQTASSAFRDFALKDREKKKETKPSHFHIC